MNETQFTNNEEHVNQTYCKGSQVKMKMKTANARMSDHWNEQKKLNQKNHFSTCNIESSAYLKLTPNDAIVRFSVQRQEKNEENF